MKSQHEFALYYPNLTNLIDRVTEKIIKVEDSDLVHRIERVLRLKKAEEFVLFDRHNHAKCVLEQFENRKTISIQLLEVAPNRVIAPEITVWLPILKRDDLEEAIYSLVELGVNSINLIQTDKVQRAWGGAKELERLQRIIIAASEQSKNYAYPELKTPSSFNDFIRVKREKIIFFDVNGKPLLDVMRQLHDQKPSQLDIIIGPEADLSAEEKNALVDVSAVSCALTPTILRARQAVAVGVGAIRSTISN